MATEIPTNWPWPTDMRKLWTTVPDEARMGGRRSIRNDALWAELRDARTAGEVAAADAWRIAAQMDGWEFRQTYGHEPMVQAFRGVRDGYVVQGLARLGTDNSLPHGEVSAWCPKGISLMPLPVVYPGFAAMQALGRHCPVCKADDVDTARVAFANRACGACAPGLRQKLETSGWCD